MSDTEFVGTGVGSTDDAPVSESGAEVAINEDMEYTTQSVTVQSIDLRYEEMDGDDYVIAPVTAVKSMILKGEFLPFDEIQRTSQAWNGRLLALTHPKEGGRPVPASIPRNYEQYGIGWIFNAEPVDNGLDAEAWFDVDASARVAGELGEPDPVEQLENDQELEVSTGYWYDRQEEQGEFDGQEYTATQHNIRPDHLAALPSSIGECSIGDGCGITANEFEASQMSTQRELDEEVLALYAGSTNVNASPRTPEFSGTETQEDSQWGDVPLTFEAFVEGYADDNPDASEWDDLTQSEKDAISARSLNGDPSADTFNDAMTLPVVNPATDNLHEGGLDAALSRAPQTNGINVDETQSLIRSMLEEHFDRDLADEAQTLMQRLRSLVVPSSEAKLGNTDTEQQDECGCNHPDEDDTMNETIEQLVEQTKFSEEQLEAMDEEQIEALESTLEEQKEEQEEQAEQEEEEEETEETTEETGSNDELSEQVSSLADSVETVNDNVQSLSDRLEDVEESQSEVQSQLAEQENERRSELTSQIVTHSNLSEEQLPNEVDQLEALAEELKPRGGWAGGTVSTANEGDGADIALGLNEAMESGD